MRSANLHIFYRRRLYFLLIAVSFPEPRAQRVVFFLQKKNNVQKHIVRKIFRRHEKSSEAKCLEALILVVEVVGIEPATQSHSLETYRLLKKIFPSYFAY